MGVEVARMCASCLEGNFHSSCTVFYSRTKLCSPTYIWVMEFHNLMAFGAWPYDLVGLAVCSYIMARARSVSLSADLIVVESGLMALLRGAEL